MRSFFSRDCSLVLLMLCLGCYGLQTRGAQSLPGITASSSELGSAASGAMDGDRFKSDPSHCWSGQRNQSEWWWQVEFSSMRSIGASKIGVRWIARRGRVWKGSSVLAVFRCGRPVGVPKVWRCSRSMARSIHGIAHTAAIQNIQRPRSTVTSHTRDRAPAVTTLSVFSNVARMRSCR